MQMVDGALSGGDAICRIDLAIGFQLLELKLKATNPIMY